MDRVEVVPGLAVDLDLYEAAVNGLKEHAPEETLAWETFTSPESWTLVPDPDEQGYKGELVLRREDSHTRKINLWFAPDLRDGQSPKPHNHPWEFTSHVLSGAYTEQRYTLVDGKVATETHTHTAGGSNHLPLDVYHEVTAISEPGRTLTLMLCGAGRQGAWGYLDPETGRTYDNTPDTSFRDRLVALNPRMKP
ncbi:hypothetical protein [Streptomyces alanosinicus]|uniref:Uncharacterized protein n=1 Tax=Streptomyces alanosinicus TaxID=68171 RepID=A0A918YUQ3_9ACTN|nr:hypothetical protein [Streptomyces alanosinicus]GHE14689.1 hypothetical protein GCM10010339_86350 [Streptomyces alanosinicus]